ncbi:MAG: polyribonucleotide nucleotidyltransferase [Candidatus Kapaibacteriales bacterium]
MEKKVVSIEFEGKEYSLETGRLAKFANGSVMVTCGETMVLVTATAGAEKEGIDFLPLTVEYREKMSAAGKIPGGFLKREGRPSEKEILTARLIDRPCRPLFAKNWYRDTQIVAQVFSADGENDPQNLAAVGASAALMISDIPFNGPIAEVRVGRINGEFIANPSYEQLEECDIDFTVAGSESSIMMVEGESKEISEEEFVQALEYGHEKIKELTALQRQLMEAVGSKEKLPTTEVILPEELIASARNLVSDELNEYVRSQSTKNERNEKRSELKEKIEAHFEENFGDNEEYADGLKGYAGTIFGKLEKEAMREMILESKTRLDGRGLEDIRPITVEVGVLPRAHGSALFTRGETQSLTTTTLGTSKDEQMIDGLLPFYTTNFYLHYNFPPFSVGETGRFGGTSRREIGHGNLAERALKSMLPSVEDFPYTIRIISDILESNGSSSMATVCAGSLSLMEAGVPVKAPVAGIAMGLIMEGDRTAILSDILGDEDFLGDMDFKVAGTSEGITACQMDIKIEGLSIDLMTTALAQARNGRLHILDKMNEVLSETKDDLSKYAPRYTRIQVPVDTIGAIIGSGGETIRSITKETNTEINIDDDGTVLIAATSGIDADKALEIIKQLTKKPEVGATYTGKIVEIRDGLGAFVEFMPKQKGLLHISEISYERTENVEDVLTLGEDVEVKLLDIRDGKFRLSRRALLEKPEGWEDRPRPPRRDGGGGNRGGDRRGNDRRGGGDRDRRGGNDRRSGDRPSRND